MKKTRSRISKACDLIKRALPQPVLNLTDIFGRTARMVLCGRGRERPVPFPSTGRVANVHGRAAFSATVVMVALATLLSACSRPAPPPPVVVTVAPTPDLAGTVTAAVQATLQASSPPASSSPPPTSQPSTPVATDVPLSLAVVLDEQFEAASDGWPNDPDGVAWYDGLYHLASRQDGHFVGLSAPLIGAVDDAIVSATFHKVGGPPGGGYGVIVRDQMSESRDGVEQGGRFIAAEIGDTGMVGIWRREEDHWVDLVPWTLSPAVHPGDASNQLTVQTHGDSITLLANGTRVAQTAMGLPQGGVGVFVGGDGNEVVLDHLVVRADRAQVKLRPTPIPPTETPDTGEPSADPGSDSSAEP
jgi:hypothetical protein